MPVLRQFPLGSVLFPTMVLPLHVFEPRYRALVSDVLEEEADFGVVLIERGREVGGSDVRTDFGTEAKIVKAEEFVDGRWSIVAVGTRRFKVNDWLEDLPYPRADVTYIDESDDVEEHPNIKPIVSKFGRLMALASEAGIDVGAVPDELGDHSTASFQMSALAPINMLDKYQLLSERSTVKRLELLDDRLSAALDAMRFRLSSDTNLDE